MRRFDNKAQNPILAVIVLISGIVIFLILYAFFSGPLGIIWSEAENASTNPNKPVMINDLSNVWMIIGTAALLLIGLWFFVYLLRREDEESLYMR